MSKVKFRQQTRVISGREARRMGEREQKREERQRQVDAFWVLSPQERAQRMADNEAFQRINRNGITIEDLRMAENQGYMNGRNAGIENTMKTCYAAICLALNENHGFDADQCQEFLNDVDQRITMALTGEDAINEVWEKMGLRINFGAGPLEERVENRD